MYLELFDNKFEQFFRSEDEGMSVEKILNLSLEQSFLLELIWVNSADLPVQLWREVCLFWKGRRVLVSDFKVLCCVVNEVFYIFLASVGTQFDFTIYLSWYVSGFCLLVILVTGNLKREAVAVEEVISFLCEKNLTQLLCWLV